MLKKIFTFDNESKIKSIVIEPFDNSDMGLIKLYYIDKNNKWNLFSNLKNISKKINVPCNFKTSSIFIIYSTPLKQLKIIDENKPPLELSPNEVGGNISRDNIIEESFQNPITIDLSKIDLPQNCCPNEFNIRIHQPPTSTIGIPYLYPPSICPPCIYPPIDSREIVTVPPPIPEKPTAFNLISTSMPSPPIPPRPNVPTIPTATASISGIRPPTPTGSITDQTTPNVPTATASISGIRPPTPKPIVPTLPISTVPAAIIPKYGMLATAGTSEPDSKSTVIGSINLHTKARNSVDTKRLDNIERSIQSISNEKSTERNQVIVRTVMSNVKDIYSIAETSINNLKENINSLDVINNNIKSIHDEMLVTRKSIESIATAPTSMAAAARSGMLASTGRIINSDKSPNLKNEIKKALSDIDRIQLGSIISDSYNSMLDALKNSLQNLETLIDDKITISNISPITELLQTLIDNVKTMINNLNDFIINNDNPQLFVINVRDSINRYILPTLTQLVSTNNPITNTAYQQIIIVLQNIENHLRMLEQSHTLPSISSLFTQPIYPSLFNLSQPSQPSQQFNPYGLGMGLMQPPVGGTTQTSGFMPINITGQQPSIVTGLSQPLDRGQDMFEFELNLDKCMFSGCGDENNGNLNSLAKELEGTWTSNTGKTANLTMVPLTSTNANLPTEFEATLTSAPKFQEKFKINADGSITSGPFSSSNYTGTTGKIASGIRSLTLSKSLPNNMGSKFTKVSGEKSGMLASSYTALSNIEPSPPPKPKYDIKTPEISATLSIGSDLPISRRYLNSYGGETIPEFNQNNQNLETHATDIYQQWLAADSSRFQKELVVLEATTEPVSGMSSSESPAILPNTETMKGNIGNIKPPVGRTNITNNDVVDKISHDLKGNWKDHYGTLFLVTVDSPIIESIGKNMFIKTYMARITNTKTGKIYIADIGRNGSITTLDGKRNLQFVDDKSIMMNIPFKNSSRMWTKV